MKQKLNKNGRITEILRFGIVGILATVLQYLFYLIFINAVSIQPIYATPISYILSLSINYILSSYFTFKSKPNKRNGLGFFMCHMLNMGLQMVLISLFTKIVSDNIAMIPTLLICVPVNYLMLRFVFRKFGNDVVKIEKVD